MFIGLLVNTSLSSNRYTRPQLDQRIYSWSDETYPIIIRSNADLAALSSGGAGTANDPYVIADLQISVHDEEMAINIRDTDAYFILFNCRIEMVRGFSAIVMSNVSYGVFEECEIIGAGVILDRCNSCEIVDCTITGSMSEVGIEILFSEDVRMKGNIISNSPSGIRVMGSENIQLSSNHIYDNEVFGIDVYLSANTSMYDNVLENNGVFLSLWWAGYNGHMIEGKQYIDVPYNFDNNSVNGKPLGFFHGITDDTIEGDTFGQIILLNCSNLEVVGGDFLKSSVGFQMHFSENCSIKGANVADNGAWGMYVFYSNFTVIENCSVHDNSWNGILLEKSPFTQISNNSIINNDATGVYLATSDNCSILNNSLSHNFSGVGIGSSSNCTVIGNELVYNSVYGILLIGDSHQNSIYGNAIGWNGAANGRDEAGYNFWDNGIDQGNSWSDYSGFGNYIIEYYGTDHYPSFLGNPIMSPVTLLMIGTGSAIIFTIIIGLVWMRKRGKRGQI